MEDVQNPNHTVPLANDITVVSDPGGNKRKAILLSALNEGTFQLVADLALPKDIGEVPYEDILILLDSHFIPKRIGFGDRHSFYIAAQQPGESHAQWAAKAVELAGNLCCARTAAAASLSGVNVAGPLAACLSQHKQCHREFMLHTLPIRRKDS